MSTTGNISIQSLVNAKVIANNTSDTSRQYGLSTEVLLQGENVEQIANGVVMSLDDEQQLASFYDSFGNFEVVFFNIQEIEKRTSILTAISNFVASVKNKAFVMA